MVDFRFVQYQKSVVVFTESFGYWAFRKRMNKARLPPATAIRHTAIIASGAFSPCDVRKDSVKICSQFGLKKSLNLKLFFAPYPIQFFVLKVYYHLCSMYPKNDLQSIQPN